MTREEFERARGLVKAMKELMAAPGWKVLRRAAVAQMRARRRAGTESMPDVSAVLERQFLLGEVAGLQLLLATPRAILEDAEAQIATFDPSNGDYE